tara:strand:+ start:178 stop:993 length:816 start_codon:yes stop_codon:yes gene_type:complete
MALPSSGQITLNQIHVEAGGSSGSQVALSDTDVKGLVGANNDNTKFSDYYGASAASGTVSFLGRSSTTTANFANGARTLSSGTKLIVVVHVGLFAGTANNGIQATSVSCGGTAMTKAVGSGGHYMTTSIGATSSIWYLETAQSGSTLISGTTQANGSGPTFAYTYEISGYNSATPYATSSANNQGSPAYNDAISVNGQSGGVTIIGGACTGPGTLTVSNGATIGAQDSATYSQFFAAAKQGISGGSQSYTITKTSNLQTQSVFSLQAISFG